MALNLLVGADFMIITCVFMSLIADQSAVLQATTGIDTKQRKNKNVFWPQSNNLVVLSQNYFYIYVLAEHGCHMHTTQNIKQYFSSAFSHSFISSCFYFLPPSPTYSNKSNNNPPASEKLTDVWSAWRDDQWHSNWLHYVVMYQWRVMVRYSFCSELWTLNINCEDCEEPSLACCEVSDFFSFSPITWTWSVFYHSSIDLSGN